jgi:hypothetical protein
MSGHWPFKKKHDLGASSSRKKVKLLPPRKIPDRAYLNIAMARAFHRDNLSVWVHDVHILDSWLLNMRG